MCLNLTEPAAREQIEEMLQSTARATPPLLEPNLPPNKFTLGESAWYPFESEIWQYGERIRQVLHQCTKLRGDSALYEKLIGVVQDRRVKRGRQPFVLLFGYKRCMPFAGRLAAEINDVHVSGHVIDSLIKMQAPGFAHAVRPFESSTLAWTRAKAKAYCRRYGA